MTLTDIQARTTQTGAYTGAGVDVSGITGDWTLKLQIEALTAGKKARITFEDSVNDFTAAISGPAFSFVGLLEKTFDKVKSFKKQDFPDLRIGTASGKLRCKVALIDGSASITYKAWLEY